MGSQRISDALASLSKGLGIMAEARYRTDEKNTAMQFEREMQDSRQAFAQRMQELQVGAQKEMQQASFTHAETMQSNQQGFQKEMFQSEQAALNARHAASLGAEWARIRQAGAQLASAQEDRKLERQLKVYELQAQQGQSQYQTVLEAMNKEMGKLSEGQNALLDKDGSKRAAAEKAITARYSPMLEEAKKSMMDGMSRYAGAVGTKADFSDVQGGVAGGAPTAGRDKVSAAVEAAKAQIGSGAMPPEQNLIAGFMKSGLSRTEALAAARQLRSSGGVR